MKTFKIKQCYECGKDFQPAGPAAKYCDDCRDDKRREAARVGTQRYRIKHGLVEKPGVGKGGNQRKGKSNTQYKNGSRYFQNNRHRIKEERRYCERCGKDLLNATSKMWCIHHRDHDRDNNIDSNFELLCKRCHQVEHDCIKALQ